MIEDIYIIHTSLKDEKYKNLSNNIIDDMLMGLNKFSKEVLVNKLTILQKNLIEDYYYIAEKLNNIYSNDKFIVYKGVYGIEYIIEEFIVPFSTAIDVEKVLHWTDDKKTIYKILVPRNTMFVCIDNTNEGREVVLPSGKIKKISQYIEFIEKDYYNIIECEFSQMENKIT